MKKLLLSLAAGIAMLPAMAHTVLMNQTFDNYWEKDYTVLELDGNAPNMSINALFMDNDGISQPWWTGKDFSGSKDLFLISHSYYNTPNTSNDWVNFPPITIPTEGFNLNFGAQSLPIRSGDEHALSDLRVYITEQPVTAEWQPSEPALLVENLGYGNDRDNCTDDFIPYTINLDQYVGKTIYISFANLNTDKDILVVDNVEVLRLDLAEVSATAPEYTVAGEFPVKVTIKGTDKEGLDNWRLTFKCGETEVVETGAKLANGEAKDFDFTGVVEPNSKATYSVTLTSDNNPDISAGGTVTGLLFQTTKRIVAEESTFNTCGNCPMALYTLEVIEESEEYAGRVFPVSIHVTQSDPMFSMDYVNMFGINVAPMVRVDRHDELISFGEVDCAPDPSNPTSAGYAIVRHLDEVALGDITVSGSYLKNAGKISGIDATAEFTPAIDMDGNKYQIGFILTENNVTAPEGQSNYWRQTNYLAGNATAINAQNPWGFMPGYVKNMRYQDVARQIYDFRGLENSCPARVMKAGEKITFNTQLGLPTLEENQGKLNPENLYLTAFIIEKGTDIPKMINANRVALGDNPEPKVSSLDMAKELGYDPSGISAVEAEFDGEAEYYNLQGYRVLEPSAGIYIVRRGSKVTKETVK